jgi:nucleotide-binding universal stress UspA family protein
MSTFNSLLVAVELKDVDSEICSDAIIFAKKMNAEVTLVHAIEYIPYYPYFPYDAEKVHDDMLKELTQKMDKLKEVFTKDGLIVNDYIIEEGHAYEIICNVANKINACAIVLGVGQHYLMEELIGSTTEKVTRMAEQKVIVINHGKQTHVDKILCAYEFSENSEVALDSAINMAKRLNVHLDILHIVPEHFYFNPVSPVVTIQSEVNSSHDEVTEAEAKVKKVLADKVGERKIEELSYDTHIARGEPLAEIFKFIKENDIDLLSIGSSGHNKFVRFFLGSTAEKILRKAPCSIMTSKVQHKD